MESLVRVLCLQLECVSVMQKMGNLEKTPLDVLVGCEQNADLAVRTLRHEHNIMFGTQDLVRFESEAGKGGTRNCMKSILHHSLTTM